MIVFSMQQKSPKVHVALAADHRLGIQEFFVLGATYRARTSTRTASGIRDVSGGPRHVTTVGWIDRKEGKSRAAVELASGYFCSRARSKCSSKFMKNSLLQLVITKPSLRLADFMLMFWLRFITVYNWALATSGGAWPKNQEGSFC